MTMKATTAQKRQILQRSWRSRENGDDDVCALVKRVRAGRARFSSSSRQQMELLVLWKWSFIFPFLGRSEYGA